MIKDKYLKRILLDNNDINSIESLNIEQEIDFSELSIMNNLKELKIYDLDLSIVDIYNISKIQSLKDLFFINCNVESLEGLVGTNIEKLYIDNSSVGDIHFIDTFNLKSLFLDNMEMVDLKEISTIRVIEDLSLNNTRVLNEDKLIYLDKIINLSIANTKIKNIDTLVANETLKLLVIDDDIFNNNKEVVRELIRRNISVVDMMNRRYEVEDA